MAPTGLTNPAAGVMATRPATIPEEIPTTVGLPAVTHSMNIHAKAAEEVATVVFTMA